MSQESSIEWTDATWNPTRGCRRVSPGCENCYAEKIAHRFSGPGLPYDGLVTVGKNGPRWSGDGRLVPDALDAPLHWRKPRKVFVNSMSDLFYEKFSNEEIAVVFGIMAACPQHTFQVLTKRPERAVEWFKWAAKEGTTVNSGRGMSVPALCLALAQKVCRHRELARNVDHTCAQAWPLPNVWIGTSVEDQQRAEQRIPWLLEVPSRVRFVSYEPALGPVNFTRLQIVEPDPPHGPGATFNSLTGHIAGPDDILPAHIDWVIAGGESGTGARTFDLQWARSAVSQCKEAGVPVFVKQLGKVRIDSAPLPVDPKADATWQQILDGHNQGCKDKALARITDSKGGDMGEWPEDLRVRDFPGVQQ